VIDKSLATLPRRKTDGAIIIRSQDSDDGKARVFKLNANAGESVLLERFVFYSIACLTSCAKCFTAGKEATNDSSVSTVHGVHYQLVSMPAFNGSSVLMINDIAGYQSTPPPAKSGPFMYIAVGALTQMQGQVPQDAFDGENGFVS